MLMRKLYKDKRWAMKRQAILRRDDFLCRECKRYGKRTDAKHVHHIVPIEEQEDLWLTDGNLISLCTECHNKMHDRNTGQLTETGQQLRHRLQRR